MITPYNSCQIATEEEYLHNSKISSKWRAETIREHLMMWADSKIDSGNGMTFVHAQVPKGMWCLCSIHMPPFTQTI